MKAVVRHRMPFVFTVISLIVVITTISFWQYRSAAAIKITTSDDYLSINAALTTEPGSGEKFSSIYTSSNVTEKTPGNYEIDYPGSGGKIAIGDISKSNNFRPDLTISTWNNEAEFKLVASNVTQEKSQFSTSLKDGIISASNGEWTFEYKTTELKEGFNDKGGLDILITAKEKPTSNRIEFTFDSSTVTPYYQPPLTDEYSIGKQEDGTVVSTVTATQVVDDKGRVIAKRPDYVVNSIAFYANEKADYEAGKTNYATGKVGHLYAMKVGDSWAGWTIEDNKIILTIPQEVLDKSEYPLTITPIGDTFGYTTIGASEVGFDSNTWTGPLFTAPASGSGVSIHAYCRNWEVGEDTKIKGALVYHSNLSIVSNGITSATSTPNNVNYAWYTCNFGTAPTITASTEYVIGFMPWFYHDVRYDTGSTNQGHRDTANNFNSPVNPSGITHSTRKLSIYVTYTTGGGGYSISNTPSSYNFGEVTPNNTISTGLNYFSVTNNSASAVKITISGTDITGGTTWTLSDTGTAGTSTAGMKAGLNGGSYNIVIKKTSPYNTLVSSLASSASQLWGFQLLSPTNYTDTIQKNGTITLTATAP